jgi:uncharacterized protein (DUF1697 family)
MHIALLRGINVGGNNRLLKEDLVSIFHDAGCTEVKTYIQSGNIVYEAESALARQIPAVIAELIVERCGFEVPVVTRTAEELCGVVAANPFLQDGVDEKTLHVAFLAAVPSEALAATLDPQRSPPDEFVVQGREIYLRCPNGLARTKLSNAYFDSNLGTVSTMRNWRTTLRLLAMAGG